MAASPDRVTSSSECVIGNGSTPERVYARKLTDLIHKTPVEIHMGAMVLSVTPGGPGRLTASTSCLRRDTSPMRLGPSFSPPAVSKIPARQDGFPGARPTGIFTTGTLQQLVNLGGLRLRARRAAILGSEHVALSSVLTLKRAGASIAGMVEEHQELHTYGYLAEAMGRLYRFPIHKDIAVGEILGNDQVEGLELVTRKGRESFRLDCDMVVVTGKFRPESPLIDNTPIEQDPSTFGPRVSMDLMTSVPDIFAAGNVLRGADMHDLCALEGRLAARNILKRMDSAGNRKHAMVSGKGRASDPVCGAPRTFSEKDPARIPLQVISMAGHAIGIHIEKCGYGSCIRERKDMGRLFP